jgi:predicted lipid carrier protein YhbT
MATVEECRIALDSLAARLVEADPDSRRRHTLDRSLSCHVRDLKVDFSGQLVDGVLQDVHQVADPAAKIKLTIGSDDLVSLMGGRLHVASAWASGRLKIDASVTDLLKLRKLF